MSRLAAVLPATLLLAIIAIVRFVIWVIEREYPYWAPRLAARVIRAAALLLPYPQRERRREEWLAELAKAAAQDGALTFALFEVLLGAPVLAAQSLWRGTDWIMATRTGMTYGLGVAVGAAGVGSGTWLGSLFGGTQWGAALGGVLGLVPVVWVVRALNARPTAKHACERSAQFGVALGFWAGAVYGIVLGNELVAVVVIGFGSVVGSVLSAWASAAFEYWLHGFAGADEATAQ